MLSNSTSNNVTKDKDIGIFVILNGELVFNMYLR